MHPVMHCAPEWDVPFRLERIPIAIPASWAACRLARTVLRLVIEMTDREAKSRAVRILAKSIYRDLEAQGFDERQIVALATELISEVTTKISRGSNPEIAVDKQHVA